MRKLMILGGAVSAMLLLPGLSLAQSPTWHHGHATTWQGKRQSEHHFWSWQGVNHGYHPWLNHESGSAGAAASQGNGSASGTTSSAAGAATSQGNSSASGSTSGSSGSPNSGTQTIDGHTVVGTLDLTATAYAPTLQDNYPYGPVDYYGNPLVAGDVAVDPSVIPLGTLLWVTGYSSPDLPAGGFLAHAVDTGGAIQGDRIDIFINASESEVSNFGIQQVTAYILK